MTTLDAAAVSEVRFAPRRLGHVNMFVSDVEQSHAFYAAVGGFEEVFAEPQIWAVFLSNGNTHHDLGLMGAVSQARVGRDGHVQVAAERGTRAGLNHLGFEMDSEAALVAAMHRADAAGIVPHRVVDHQISHSVYLFDPEENYVEIYADVTRDWRGLYERSAGQLVTGSWDPTASPPSPEPMYDPDPEPRSVAGALVAARRICGATLVVSDLASMSAFYRDVVGLDVLVEHDGVVVLGGTLGHHDLTLVERRDGQRPGLHHMSAEVMASEVLDDLAARLSAAGHTVLGELTGAGKRAVIVEDPDGVPLELLVRCDDDRSVPRDYLG